MNFIISKRWRYVFLTMALCFSMQLSAVEVPGLFEIEIVAKSESADDRTMAIKQALYAVLDRVVVAEDISKVPAIQEMLLGAEHYVKQSQYSLLPADEYANTGARQFRVRFDEDQVLEALRKSQVGIWSEIRPETLLWLVIDGDDGRQFFNPDAMPEIESALGFASKIKGVPLMYPMLDIEEQQKISVNAVLGTDSRSLMAASARYDVASIMAGRLRKVNDCWQSEWSLYFDGKIKQWRGDCQPLKSAVLTGVKGVYGELSRYYGVKPENSSATQQ